MLWNSWQLPDWSWNSYLDVSWWMSEKEVLLSKKQHFLIDTQISWIKWSIEVAQKVIEILDLRPDLSLIYESLKSEAMSVIENNK
jgi:hypothetical protein